MIRPSKNAIEFIKKFEGCRLEAYQDVGGVWTIGYGSTGPGIMEGLTISQKTAEGMLLGHVNDLGLQLVDILKSKVYYVNQQQFDALTSFVYNIGIGAFKKSHMCELLSKGDSKSLELAAQEFPRWDKVKGQPDVGLMARRKAEQELFLS